MIRIVFDFVWVSIFVSLLVGLIATVIPVLGTSGTAIGTLAGAMVAGQLYGRRNRAEATSSFAWRVALAITIATLTLTVLVVVLLNRSGAVPELDETPMASYATLIAFLGIVTLLIARYFFRLGSRNGAKSVGGSS